MEVVAKISKEWRRRMLFMFLMVFGIGAWFLTDGYVFWPSEQQRYLQYAEIRDQLIESGDAEDEEDPVLRIEWQQHARETGLSGKVPKERTDASIKEQRVIGLVMAPGALLFLLWVIWNHRLTIEAHGETIKGASGQVVEFGWITGTDRKKWKNKGIAYALYEEDGKQKRLCLDEHKFKGSEAILLEAERRIEAQKEASEA